MGYKNKNQRKPVGYWEVKENVIDEAKKFDTRSEFMRDSAVAYKYARINNWLEESCSHMREILKPNGYWSDERLAEEALKYSSRKAFSKGSNSAYLTANRKGIMDKIASHMTPLGHIGRRFVYRATFPDGAVYIGLTCDFNRRVFAHNTSEKSAVYRYAKQTNTKPLFELVTNKLYPADEAAELEEFIVEEYKLLGRVVLNVAKCGGLGSAEVKWTFEKLRDEALLYETRQAFRDGSKAAYSVASKKDYFGQICSHMRWITKPSGYWTKEKIFEECAKHDTKKDFYKKSKDAYLAAVKMKLLSELYDKMNWEPAQPFEQRKFKSKG